MTYTNLKMLYDNKGTYYKDVFVPITMEKDGVAEVSVPFKKYESCI